MALNGIFGNYGGPGIPDSLDYPVDPGMSAPIADPNQAPVDTWHNPYDGLLTSAEEALRNSVAIPLAQPAQMGRIPNPTLLQTGLAFLGNLTDPNHAMGSNALQGLQQRLGQQAQLDFQNRQIDAQTQERARQQQIELAKTGLDISSDRYSRADKEHQAMLNMEAKRLDNANSVLEKAYTDYRSIKKPSDVPVFAARLNAAAIAAGRKDFVIDQATIVAKQKELANNNLAQAQQMKMSLIKELSPDGVLSEQEATAGNQRLRAVEEEYGLTPGILGNLPTFQTLAKAKADQLQKNFDRTFVQRQGAIDNTFKFQTARLAMERYRLDVLRQNTNFDNQMEVARFNQVGARYADLANRYGSTYGKKVQEWLGEAERKKNVAAKALNRLKEGDPGYDEALKAFNEANDDWLSVNDIADDIRASASVVGMPTQQNPLPQPPVIGPPPGGSGSGSPISDAPKGLVQKAYSQSPPARAYTEAGHQLVQLFGGRFEQWADRNIAGTNTPSRHTTGQAIDFYPEQDMQQVAKQLAGASGISMVIHNRQIWTPSKGWHPYTGKDPHTDHIHIELGGNAASTNQGSPVRKIAAKESAAPKASGKTSSGGTWELHKK